MASMKQGGCGGRRYSLGGHGPVFSILFRRAIRPFYGEFVEGLAREGGRCDAFGVDAAGRAAHDEVNPSINAVIEFYEDISELY
ncbi:hypothetical protein [Mesorhizobium sp. M0254]|uniref:hypothetical protein n=1 Tax=Mesorhizobium sp. M0254 TaxID=2956927 RepID=UPI003338F685